MNKYFLFLFLVFLLFFFPVNTLEIRFNEKTVCYSPILSTLTLKVRYKHSVSLTNVVDVYRINESGLSAVQERWQEFEAGQPMEGRIEDGYMVKDMNLQLGKSWEYWFIPLNNVTLELNDKRINFKPDEEGIMQFRVEKNPVLVPLLRWC